MTEHANIYVALCAAQSTMGKVTKGSVNPLFKSKYADLSDVVSVALPALTAQGIAMFHSMTRDEHGMIMRTTLSHGMSDTHIQCDVPLIVDRNNMQGMKSAITYAKRIGLESLAGIAADEDDDGNAASKKSNKPVSDADRNDANDWIECMDQCQSVDELAAYFKTIWDDVKVKPTEIMNTIVAAKDAAKKKLAGGQ